jgi:hypothetical protein
MAVPYVKRLVAGFLQRQLGSSPGQLVWDLWWTKWHWSRFSPSILVSHVNFHSTDSYTIITIYHPGLVQ